MSQSDPILQIKRIVLLSDQNLRLFRSYTVPKLRFNFVFKCQLYSLNHFTSQSDYSFILSRYRPNAARWNTYHLCRVMRNTVYEHMRKLQHSDSRADLRATLSASFNRASLTYQPIVVISHPTALIRKLIWS